MCQRHGSDRTPTLLFESKNHLLINFFATSDRYSIMTRMYRRFMMIYSSPQAKFKGTMSNGRIHRYGAFIFGGIIINASNSISEDK